MTLLSHHRTKLGFIAAGTVIVLLLVPNHARAQLIDAGGQANLMHQHALMRQQSGTDEPGQFKRPASKAHSPSLNARNEAIRDMQQIMAQRREELRPEYQRRVAQHGEAAANAWLRKRAAELGREDGRMARARLNP